MSPIAPVVSVAPKASENLRSQARDPARPSRCTCEIRTDAYFCHSKMCRNHQRDRPQGSTTVERVGADEGSSRNTISTTRSETHPLPKPETQQGPSEYEQLMKHIPELLAKADGSTNSEILQSLRRAGDILKTTQQIDYWTTNEGQAELLRMIDEKSRRGPAKS